MNESNDESKNIVIRTVLRGIDKTVCMGQRNLFKLNRRHKFPPVMHAHD